MKQHVQSFDAIGLRVKLNTPPFFFEHGLQLSQPSEMRLQIADRGFALPAYIAGRASAVSTSLFQDYCIGVEITGFDYTTAETETSVQVNKLNLLVKLELHQVCPSANQNNNLKVIAS